jgi:hypothetical protein
VPAESTKHKSDPAARPGNDNGRVTSKKA